VEGHQRWRTGQLTNAAPWTLRRSEWGGESHQRPQIGRADAVHSLARSGGVLGNYGGSRVGENLG
jgi:hypothetical protein